jgi:hypothetical protein
MDTTSRFPVVHRFIAVTELKYFSKTKIRLLSDRRADRGTSKRKFKMSINPANKIEITGISSSIEKR